VVVKGPVGAPDAALALAVAPMAPEPPLPGQSGPLRDVNLESVRRGWRERYGIGAALAVRYVPDVSRDRTVSVTGPIAGRYTLPAVSLMDMVAAGRAAVPLTIRKLPGVLFTKQRLEAKLSEAMGAPGFLFFFLEPCSVGAREVLRAHDQHRTGGGNSSRHQSSRAPFGNDKRGTAHFSARIRKFRITDAEPHAL